MFLRKIFNQRILSAQKNFLFESLSAVSSSDGGGGRNNGVVSVGGVVGRVGSGGGWEKSREGEGCVGRGPPCAQYRPVLCCTAGSGAVPYRGQ